MATTFTVPAQYVEDARNALIAELINDGQFLQNEQESLSSATDDAHRDTCREDRAFALRTLRTGLGLLDQLPDAPDAGDVELVADYASLWHMLEG
jgi:hypothetical protein